VSKTLCPFSNGILYFTSRRQDFSFTTGLKCSTSRMTKDSSREQNTCQHSNDNIYIYVYFKLQWYFKWNFEVHRH
jgi:hypothetical protein